MVQYCARGRVRQFPPGDKGRTVSICDSDELVAALLHTSWAARLSLELGQPAGAGQTLTGFRVPQVFSFGSDVPQVPSVERVG